VAVLHVVRVFCAEDGSGGNPLGVFLDGPEIAAQERQSIAAELGYSETVFVDDRGAGAMRIFTPVEELPLAGHPLVGTAWLLRETGGSVDVLRPPAGEVGVRFEEELAFVSADPEWGPPWDLLEVESPNLIDSLPGPPQGHKLAAVWSWTEAPDTIRARVFAPESGVPEDPATGSAALRLAALVGRPIQIRQGPQAESLIYARPLEGGIAEVGGRVELDHAGEWTPEDGRPPAG
jgi:predicted PhzF superfamily epimerase YddE/YHI9